MTVIHIILMAPYIQTKNEELYLYNNDVTYYVISNVSQHSIGSTPHNNATYYVRRNVETQTECHAIKVPELESKLVVHSSIIVYVRASTRVCMTLARG